MRKSSRQPVPNPIYQEGITELKKDTTSRAKKKGKNNEESYVSNEEEYNSYHNHESGYDISGKCEYLNCKMPGGANLKVKFVLENKQEEKKRDKEKEREREKEREKEVLAQTPKPPPKNNKPTNLLNLFFQAIEDADGPEKQPTEPPKLIHQEPPKQVIPKQKAVRNEGEDFIKEISIENKRMRIVHSQLKESKEYMNIVEIPLEWEGTEMVEEQDLEVDEIKKRLEKCKILKSISIFA